MNCAAAKVRAPWRALLVALFIFCSTGWSQSTRPAAASASIEDEPLLRSSNVSSSNNQNGVAVSRPNSFLEFQRVIFALAIVLGLIFALRWGAKKIFPNAIARNAGGVVKVLSRSPVSPKQQVVLVQVGRRVLVVADNGTQMTSLSQITDADEVASLIGQLSGAHSTVEKEKFDDALGKAADDFEEKPAEENVGLAQNEIQGLMQKVRNLAKELGGQP